MGSAIRFLIGKSIPLGEGFPYGTFLVNVLGSFAIGIIMGFALKNNGVSQNTVLFLATGFCGGFTTFSAFALENYGFLKNGDTGMFALYVFGSIVLGLASVFLGMWMPRYF